MRKRKVRRKRLGTDGIRQKMKDLGFVRYKDYLKSQHWKEIKKRFFASKIVPKENGVIVCACCRTNDKQLEVHHRTYGNLGKEYLTDLTLLCEDCHEKTHELNKKGKKLFNAHRMLKTRMKNSLIFHL